MKTKAQPALRRIEKARQSRAWQLDLSDNQLSTLPEAIGQDSPQNLLSGLENGPDWLWGAAGEWNIEKFR